MKEVLDKVSEFVNNGLSFLGLSDYCLETVLGQVTQIVLQLIATIILFLVIKHFLWNKLTALIEARHELVNRNLNDAKKANLEAQQRKSEIEKEYQDAKEEIRKLISDSIKEGTRQKEIIIEEAKNEANRRLKQADEQIKDEIEGSKSEIKNAIVDIAFDLASKVCKREIDKEKHDEVINNLIEEVGRING